MIHPFPNYNGCTVEVSDWISKFHSTLKNGCDYIFWHKLSGEHIQYRQQLEPSISVRPFAFINMDQL